MKQLPVILLLSVLLFPCCRKFPPVGDSPAGIPPEELFRTNAGAETAMRSVYEWMMNAAGMTNGYLSRFPGLYADELRPLELPSLPADMPYFRCELQASDMILANLWAKPYDYIYQLNLIIEQLAKTPGTSADVQQQLGAEARFLRALLYFYLVNLFGPVPLITVTEFETSSTAGRSDTDDIYALIVDDLHIAEQGLTAAYDTLKPRYSRVSRPAATALLSRVYLYKQEYRLAEEKATAVIGSGLYQLESLDKVFLADSRETIFQLKPVTADMNTMEANFYLPMGSLSPSVVITEELYAAFEAGDQRKQQWLQPFRQGANTYYYPYKYKTLRSTPAKECNILLRLGESYLIRAEARAQQNKLYGANGAVADLNSVRRRSGLGGLPNGLSKKQVLDAVEQERRVELFTEWGHRWFDLKRMAGRNDPAQSRADEVLPARKPAYKRYKALFPIPQGQLMLNRTWVQNEGY